MTRPRPSLAVSALALWLMGVTASAGAQPPVTAPVHVERRSAVLAGGELARLAVRWASSVEESGVSLALGDGPPTVLARGGTAGAVERGERVGLVAYITDDAQAPFRVRAIRAEGGRQVLGEELRLARPGGRSGDYPLAVVIAPIPSVGFAVLFEEVQHDDPTAARTYLFRLDLDGRAMGAGSEVAIPWPLAAAVWNGRGFHLALVYPGGGDGLRLSMVSITADGRPEQHPDWSSAAGFVSDVHLVARGDRITAHYRGGPGGEHWHETDVTQIGSWGGNTRTPTDHGRMAAGETIALDASGRAQRVAPRADGLGAAAE